LLIVWDKITCKSVDGEHNEKENADSDIQFFIALLFFFSHFYLPPIFLHYPLRY